MKPNIYAYSKALDFFKDSYRALKLTSETSLREWCKGIDIENPNVILDLLKNKRPLKLKYADLFSKGFQLNKHETFYFKTLIQYEKAPEDSKEYYKELLNMLKPQDAFIDIEGGIFSHWLNIVILELANIYGSNMKIENVQKALKQDIPLSTIKDSLKLLVNQGHLVESSDGAYKLSHTNALTTPNDVRIKSSHAYYSQVLHKAQHAIMLDITEREFQCFAMGMKKEDLIKAKEIIRRARNEIGMLSDNGGDHVYQFNFNGFPLAEV
jgi:uncharacterized protein (TIGR02147 family)